MKTGHLLLPGRLRCGTLTCAHIGIRSTTLDSIGVKTFVNVPAALARRAAPAARSRGTNIRAAMRWWFPAAPPSPARRGFRRRRRCAPAPGLVTLASPTEALAVNASALTSVMVRAADGPKGPRLCSCRRAQERRRDRPGARRRARRAAQQVEAALAPQAYRRAAVLDADALTSFAGDPDAPVARDARRARPGGDDAARRRIRRLFAACESDRGRRSKLDKARDAARVSGAVVLYKGPDTVVAAPDGRASILSRATPWLATAGSGDVLTGIVAGLLAQGMDGFLAASCAVWMHARAAEIFGPGLIADDIIATLPQVWRELCGASA